MTVIIQGDQLRNLNQGILVSRTTGNIPQTASTGIFTIAGKVVLLGLFGEVTTVIGAVANAAKIVYNPTAAGASTDLCATLDINAAAVGLYLALPAAVGSALTSGVLTVPNAFPPRVLGPGQIEFSTAASTTGQIKWDCFYIAFSNGASVVAA